MIPELHAIGSVLPLPSVGHGQRQPDSLWTTWTSGYRNATAYSSARAALAALLAFRRVQRLWLPAYACRALAEGGRACELFWYGIDANLSPDLSSLISGLRSGDAVVVIDYFGRPAGLEIRTLASDRPDVLWVSDCAHVMEPTGTPWSDVALYSPRKLIGVADGGLLVANKNLPTPSGPRVARSAAAQIARRADQAGFYPDAWFPAFQAQEAAFAVDDTPMSMRTRYLMERVSVLPLIVKRKENVSVLVERLSDLALWPEASSGFAHSAFPVRVEQRDTLAANLASRGIYCARHWADVPSDPSAFPMAHKLSNELLSLPCDHRYGLTDMVRIVMEVRSFQARRAG